MNKAKEKAIKHLKKNKCYSGDDESKWYLPFIEEALDIAIKEVIKDLLKYNSSFPVSDERVNFEKMIKEFQNTAFTEKVEKD